MYKIWSLSHFGPVSAVGNPGSLNGISSTSRLKAHVVFTGASSFIIMRGEPSRSRASLLSVLCVFKVK